MDHQTPVAMLARRFVVLRNTNLKFIQTLLFYNLYLNLRYIWYNSLMLISSTKFIGCPVLSLHVGGQIAQVTELIIDPRSLKLIAVRVEGPMIRDDVGDILPIESVREFSKAGIIIDSTDDLAQDDDIVKIKEVLKLNFNLKGLKVITRKKAKLGKVSDYILRSDTWEAYQLIVQRPLVKSLLDPELIISRSQIVEVDDYQIIVKDEHDRQKAKTVSPTPAEDFVPNFVNPFRKPDFAPENQSDTE